MTKAAFTLSFLDQKREAVALKLGYVKRVYRPGIGYFLVELPGNDGIIHTTHEAGERELPIRSALRNVPMWGIDAERANAELETLLKVGYRLDDCGRPQDDTADCILNHPDKANNPAIRCSGKTLAAALRAYISDDAGYCRPHAFEEPTISFADDLLRKGATIKAEYLQSEGMFYVDVWKHPSGRGCGDTFALALFNAIYEHVTS